MTTWWINQGRSYANEFGLQIVFAGTDGRQMMHHLVLGEMEVGDTTLHYASGFLRAIGFVTDSAVTKLRPYEEPPITKDNGFEVGVKYFELSNRIPIATFPSGRVGAGPFDRNGRVKQGYAFKVASEWSESLRNAFLAKWPVGSPWNSING